MVCLEVYCKCKMQRRHLLHERWEAGDNLKTSGFGTVNLGVSCGSRQPEL